MSKKELEFAVFCIENIADYLHMNAQDIYQLLGVRSRILFEYIVPSFEPLHTQSKEYIINEVIELMKQKDLQKMRV
ncbi:MAG TPA: transcriptional regulator [Firmicutes bacterium]|nr:transcriptional regulator [Bacillota bacterium]